MWLLLATFMISLLQRIMTCNVKKKYTNKLIKNQYNIFSFEREEDVCPLPGSGQSRPLLLLLPSYVQIEDDLLNCGPCPNRRSGKISSCDDACHTQACCLLMLFLGLNFLPQPLLANTLPLCCQILCWLSICKDLKALSQTLQGWILSLSCALSPHTDPIQRQHDFPHKPALSTCRSSCQQMEIMSWR